jgi:hypothetical protein
VSVVSGSAISVDCPKEKFLRHVDERRGKSGDLTDVHGIHPSVCRIMEQRIAANDRHVSPASAVNDFCLAAWNHAAWIATPDRKFRSAQGAGEKRFEFVIRRLNGRA